MDCGRAGYREATGEVMGKPGIYQYTGIARPVDPAYPTNRAVLVLLPLIALLSAGSAWLGLSALVSPAAAALSGTLVAFATWALTRELAPDDEPAAFISMLIGVLVLLGVGPATVLPSFATLFLVRIANRTTGRPATIADTVMVLGLSVWVAFSLGQPLFSAAAAAAFLVDASLPKGQRRQFLAALVASAATVAILFSDSNGGLTVAALPVTDLVLLGAVAVAYLVVLLTQSEPSSIGDVGGNRLESARVRAGMLLGLVIALQGFVTTHVSGYGIDPWIWCALTGVSLGRLRPGGLRPDAGGGK